MSPQPSTFESGGARFAAYRLNSPRPDPELLFVHGWGTSSESFMPLAESLAGQGQPVLLDLPGFGQAGPAPAEWGTRDYADAIADWLRQQGANRRIWAGHSFGCRVIIQLAAHYPDLVNGMVLVAAAGLPRRRSPWQRLVLRGRILAFKLAKRLTPEGEARERLYRRFGSSDARNAGPLRAIFVRVVNEDLTDTARQVRVPTVLVYGAEDDDTPPNMGERYRQLIPGAQLRVLKGFDHHTILTRGRHQIAVELRRMLDAIA